jgi:hypothetical protein
MSFPRPTLTVPSLSPFELNYNGALTIGGTTAWGVLNIEGLDLANIATKDVGKPRDSGQLAGLNLLMDRTVTIDMWLKSDGVSMQDTQLQLATAFPNMIASDSFPLWFQLPNLPILCVMCRVVKRTVKIDSDYANSNIAKPTLVLHATDSRIYGAGQSQPMGLGSGPGTGVTFGSFPGHGLPDNTGTLTFPVTFGSGSAGNMVTLDNTGNCATRPQLLFTGPLTNPFVDNITQGASLLFSDPYQGASYTVLAGDQMLVDLDTHVMTYYPGGMGSGEASYTVANFLKPVSDWWDLAPGDNTIWFGSADSTNVGGTCELSWAPSWQL